MKHSGKIWRFGLSAGLSLVLFIVAGSINSAEMEGNNSGSGAGVQDYEEMFSAGDSNGVVYIDWLSPKATNDSSRVSWFLGAYKYILDGQCLELDRAALANNLRYAINYSACDDSALYLNLLDTNGVVVAELGSVTDLTNAVWYVVSTESQSNNVVLLNIPTAEYSEAAVIQLKSGHGEIAVYEGLLYIDEDGDGFTAEMERRMGTSDYSFDGMAGGISNYDEYFNSGSLTNNTGGGGESGGGDGEDDEEDDGHDGKIIYVDQAIGNDTFTGRSPNIAAAKKGPKKTVRGGLGIAGTNDTIIIRSGNYNENLNIQGKDVKVFIEGKVRL